MKSPEKHGFSDDSRGKGEKEVVNLSELILTSISPEGTKKIGFLMISRGVEVN